MIRFSVGAYRFRAYQVPLTQPEIARRYDTSCWWSSRLYRAIFHSAYRRLFQNLQRYWLPELLPGTDLQVLDVGIGTGVFSDALLSVVGNRAQMHGVDISPRMLEQAQTFLDRYGVKGDLVCGDAQPLPYKDGSINLVLCAFMLYSAQGRPARCYVRWRERHNRMPPWCWLSYLLARPTIGFD